VSIVVSREGVGIMLSETTVLDVSAFVFAVSLATFLFMQLYNQLFKRFSDRNSNELGSTEITKESVSRANVISVVSMILAVLSFISTTVLIIMQHMKH
jgi:4-hydroxybenzoate polyprenyltransferase